MKSVLVTGATGYIGGRLVPRLLEAGYEVHVLVRSPQKLVDVPWADQVTVIKGDLTDAKSVVKACAGRDVVYYLVHSMGSSGNFEKTELRAAHVVAQAAADAGVGRIVYLGGLHPKVKDLSPHLASRQKVGKILMDSGVPTAALQAGVVIGSGSTSFEMIRHLTDVLPVMPAPKWVHNLIQPIAVRDVLHYLLASAELPPEVNRTFDIGGPDVLRYSQMMKDYALEAGLGNRRIAALPVLTQYDCVMAEHDIDALIPKPEGGLTSYRKSVRLALAKLNEGEVETTWQNSSVFGAPSDPLPSDPEWAGQAVFTDHQEQRTEATPEHLWTVIEGIGGENGWYSFPLGWALRGWMDKLVGGVGLRRGRRHPQRLQTGEALDFWRVEQLERGKLLLLRAEMKVPGLAWLEMRVTPDEDGSIYSQRAIFFPKGLSGRLYWFAVLPFHGFIFRGMANRITSAAVTLDNE